jgi:tRNA(adenine34) deaminase
MREALREADKAFAEKEIPVGAIVELNGEIVGRGHNRTETEKDPTAHAEMNALREAAKALDGWRLTGCRMYVTVEPCAMCAGALVLARVYKVYIGATNEKSGACVSLRNLLRDERLNHFVEMETGILREECETLMKRFFKEIRSDIGKSRKRKWCKE